MTVNRTAGVLALAFLLAGCTTTPAPPSLAVTVISGAELPPFPDAAGAKYHNSRSLCDAVAAQPVKGFTPTKMSVGPGSDTSSLLCIVSDDSDHDILVSATVGDAPTASTGFEHSALGGSPVSGIGDRAYQTSSDHPLLYVLREANYYVVATHVYGDNVAIEKEIALAVV